MKVCEQDRKFPQVSGSIDRTHYQHVAVILHRDHTHYQHVAVILHRDHTHYQHVAVILPYLHIAR